MYSYIITPLVSEDAAPELGTAIPLESEDAAPGLGTAIPLESGDAAPVSAALEMAVIDDSID